MECGEYLRQFLLLAYQTTMKGRSLLVFRLHQFIAGAGDVFTTLEPLGERYLTMVGQQFRPGDRDKPLFPVVFCRACGQEYLPVWITIKNRQPKRIESRELNERTAEEESVIDGYFMPDPQQCLIQTILSVIPTNGSKRLAMARSVFVRTSVVIGRWDAPSERQASMRNMDLQVG